MKKIILLSLAMLFVSSCAPVLENRFYYMSYKPLSDEGIQVTASPSVAYEYESLGTFTLVCESGYMTKNDLKRRDRGEDGVYSSNQPTVSNRKYKSANAEDAQQTLAQYLHSINANGVINIRMQYLYIPKTSKVTSVIISGEAIKRTIE